MSRINIIALVAFVGLLVWIFLFGQNAVENIQRGAMAVAGPFIKGSNTVGETVTGFGDEQLSDAEVRKKYREIEFERDRLKLEVLRLDELMEENNALRDALNYTRNSPLELVPAQVIGRKPNTWYNTMIIDKGSADKIEADCPVIVPVGKQAALVGKISAVQGETTSVVILLSDETCQVSARIQGSTEQGIMSGQRGALRVMPDLRLNYLRKDAAIEPGRLVITSGAGGLFPENLLLGTVKTFTPGTITGVATVEAGVSFDVLKNVFVVLPEENLEEEGIEPSGDSDSSGESSVPSDSTTQTTARPLE